MHAAGNIGDLRNSRGWIEQASRAVDGGVTTEHLATLGAALRVHGRDGREIRSTGTTRVERGVGCRAFVLVYQLIGVIRPGIYVLNGSGRGEVVTKIRKRLHVTVRVNRI